MVFELEDKDLGYEDLFKKSTEEKSVDVGILEDSPREQFRLGMAQEFKPETAGTLIRKPVDSVKKDIGNELKKAGADFLFNKSSNGKKVLAALGEKVAKNMRDQTDSTSWGGASKGPRPQLAQAIKSRVNG